MAQEVKTITSEALEASYRALTPSQAGFSQDLMASNTIIPVLDLTSAAEGSSVPEFLQRAMDFASDTKLAVNNSQTLVNTAGFWQINYQISMGSNSGGDEEAHISISDGVTSKKLIDFWVRDNVANPAQSYGVQDTIVVFVNSGDTITSTSTDVDVRVSTSTRQIADVNGVLVNPQGFTPQ
jgi:hypothetical protein